MTYKNFEEYLMTICMEEIPATDDMYPDIYEDWIVEQDVDDIIRLANLYGEHKVLEGMNVAIKNLKNTILEGGDKHE